MKTGFQLLLTSLIVGISGVNSLRCYMDNSHQPEVVDFPTVMKCNCSEWNQSVRQEFVQYMRELRIVECEQISINATLNQNKSNSIDIHLSDGNETLSFEALAISKNTDVRIDGNFVSVLHLILPSPEILPSIKISNVEHTEITFHGNAIQSRAIDFLGITTEQLYFYLVIVLGALLLICVVVIIPTITCCLFKGPDSSGSSCCKRKLSTSNYDASGSKRVSRAESWRYESNIYVNPRNRVHRSINQHVPYHLVPHGAQQRQGLLDHQQQVEQPPRRQSQQPQQLEQPYHIGQYLGEATQFPMHIGLPSPDHNEDRTFSELNAQDSFEDDLSNEESDRENAYGKTSTLPITK